MLDDRMQILGGRHFKGNQTGALPRIAEKIKPLLRELDRLTGRRGF